MNTLHNWCSYREWTSFLQHQVNFLHSHVRMTISHYINFVVISILRICFARHCSVSILNVIYWRWVPIEYFSDVTVSLVICSLINTCMKPQAKDTLMIIKQSGRNHQIFHAVYLKNITDDKKCPQMYNVQSSTFPRLPLRYMLHKMRINPHANWQ